MEESHQKNYSLNSFDMSITEPEITISNLISKSIAPLRDGDEMVHSLLISKIQSGFFEKTHSKKAVNTLADKIIEIISQVEGEDAY